MPRTIETTVYQYDELDERAQAKARDWFRDSAGDDGFDSVLEMAADVARMLGFDIRTRKVKLMNGSTRNDPAIYFSGFSSQGDGASFEGTWRAANLRLQLGKVQAEFPQDKELHRLAAVFERAARNFPEGWFAVEHRGHYQHSGWHFLRV